MGTKSAAKIRSAIVAACSRGAHRFGDGVLDLLFPGACLSCGVDFAPKGKSSDEGSICSACVDELKLFDGPICRRCGAPQAKSGPIIVPKGGGCFHCAGRKLWFDAAVAAGHYSGRLRELLLRMKHSEGIPLTLAMARLTVGCCREQLTDIRADVVVPVPMHWRRRLVRGTNSAAILAEVIAAKLQAPMADGLLKRCRNTPPQSSLTPPQRWENMRRAFSVRRGYYLRRAHVLLVDDILTTGATCSEAARELRNAGAQRITVVVVARSVSK